LARSVGTRPLRDRIEGGAVERGAGLIDRIALLIKLWSLAHGLASLFVDGRLA
jgi:hypothetical protein